MDGCCCDSLCLCCCPVVCLAMLKSFLWVFVMQYRGGEWFWDHVTGHVLSAASVHLYILHYRQIPGTEGLCVTLLINKFLMSRFGASSTTQVFHSTCSSESTPFNCRELIFRCGTSTSVTSIRTSFRAFATRGRGRPAMMVESLQIMMWRCLR